MARIHLFSDSHGVFAAMQALRARVEADAPDLVGFLEDRPLEIRRVADGGTLRAENLVVTSAV